MRIIKWKIKLEYFPAYSRCLVSVNLSSSFFSSSKCIIIYTEVTSETWWLNAIHSPTHSINISYTHCVPDPGSETWESTQKKKGQQLWAILRGKVKVEVPKETKREERQEGSQASRRSPKQRQGEKAWQGGTILRYHILHGGGGNGGLNNSNPRCWFPGLLTPWPQAGGMKREDSESSGLPVWHLV